MIEDSIYTSNEQRKEWRDENVSRTNKIFTKYGITFEEFGVENVVITDFFNYYGGRFYVSLKTFKFRLEGSRNWVKKNRGLKNLSYKIPHGKYEDKTIKWLLGFHPEYIYYLLRYTTFLPHPDVTKALIEVLKDNE